MSGFGGNTWSSILLQYSEELYNIDFTRRNIMSGTKENYEEEMKDHLEDIIYDVGVGVIY